MDISICPAQAEVTQLRCTIREVQDRILRIEVYLVAAGSGQTVAAETKCKSRVEKVLEERVALLTQSYSPSRIGVISIQSE